LKKSQNSFTFQLTISESDIDQLNHVNNVQYLNWVQLAAIKHWNKLSSKSIDEKYVWVVARHEIDYILPAFLNDKLTVKTWIGKTKGKISERFVEFYKNEKLIVKVKTIWCIMNKTTMKSCVIPDEVLTILD
jgi:acyl-CoA thioester hydrolase